MNIVWKKGVKMGFYRVTGVKVGHIDLFQGLMLNTFSPLTSDGRYYLPKEFELAQTKRKLITEYLYK